MTSEPSLREMRLTPRAVRDQLSTNRRGWKSRGAVFGLGFGILSPLCGSALTAISWFTGPLWHGFAIQSYGTVLLFLTIPLLIFGAHCLDLIDQENQARKKQAKSSRI